MYFIHLMVSASNLVNEQYVQTLTFIPYIQRNFKSLYHLDVWRLVIVVITNHIACAK